MCFETFASRMPRLDRSLKKPSLLLLILFSFVVAVFLLSVLVTRPS